MAIMYPKKINEHANAAEKKMYKILGQGLGHLNVCYHNYNIIEKEMDFMILIPGEGIVIIEVKGWNGNDIEEIVDNKTIHYRDKLGKIQEAGSPLKQANGYRFNLVNQIKQELGLNIKVSSLVCYPFMSEETFKVKGLKVVSSRELTILKDDLEDIHQFSYILKKKYSYYMPEGVDPFNQMNYWKVRTLFETEGNLETATDLPKRKIKRLFADKKYSLLAHIPEIVDKVSFENQLKGYYYSWLCGTKIILILGDESYKTFIYEFFEKQLKDEIAYLGQYESFLFYDDEKDRYKDRIFNFEMHIGKLTSSAFEMIDGDEKIIKSLEQELREADEKTSFNYKQYLIEHHLKEDNMLVKAGAGTGKTYSMVSRVSYLYYSKKYAPEDLVNGVIMITFTNEAAQNMKIRLKEHFTNMAILTESIEYLRVMENVSRMKISTIHSLSKKIIERYSKYLGMGSKISIKSGIYERKLEIQKILDEEISRNDQYKLLLLRAKKYELISTIEDLLDELERKNINLEKDYSFDTPNTEPELFELMIKVAKRVQKNMIDINIRNNTVHLSNLMIYLGKLIEGIEAQKHLKEKVDYVFVDEFQDTDDVQIELIRRFYDIFKFKLFVVGDIKQSIYRFRGAEDKAFKKLQDEIHEWPEDFSLNKNYRSDRVLLEKFDHLFANWGKAKVLDYQVGQDGSDDRLIGVKVDHQIKEHIKHVEFEESQFNEILVGTIQAKQRDLDEKYTGKDKKGKIAILVRKNEEIELVRKACQGSNINLDTDVAQNLYQMTPTKDLYYLILAIQFNTSAKYLYTLSQTNYCRRISNRVVYQNKTVPDRIIGAFMQGKIMGKWEKYMDDLKNKPVLRVVRDIIEDTEPWNNYASQFEDKEQEKKRLHYKMNLDLLIEDIVQSSDEQYLTINKLEEFLYIKIFANQHQDERSVEEITSEHEIKCLTVHKSKGLEYDHVILPFVHSELTSLGMNKMIINDKQIYLRLKINDELMLTSQNFNKQIKQEKLDTLCEEARILYVALTRAEDTVTWLNQKDFQEKNGQKYWKTLLNEEV